MSPNRLIVDVPESPMSPNRPRIALAQSPQPHWVMALRVPAGSCIDAAQVRAAGRANRRDRVLVPGTAWRVGCVIDAVEEDARDAVGD